MSADGLQGSALAEVALGPVWLHLGGPDGVGKGLVVLAELVVRQRAVAVKEIV